MYQIIMDHLHTIPGYLDLSELYHSLYLEHFPLNATQTIAVYLCVLLGLAMVCFGFKMVRVWGALLGFVVGYLATVIVVNQIPSIQGDLVIVLSSITGVVLAALFSVFNKVSIFVSVLCIPFIVIQLAFAPTSVFMCLFILVFSLVVAIGALKFSAPIVMIITSVAGGAIAGLWLCYILGFIGLTRMLIVIGIMLFGGMIQFLMHNGKMKRKQKRKADAIKATQSTETHVEDARTFLERDDVSSDQDVHTKEVTHKE